MRGDDLGKDFDAHYRASRRRAAGKRERGESHWATDKYLERERTRSAGPAHHAKSSDSCLIFATLLGGAGWALSELAGRILS